MAEEKGKAKVKSRSKFHFFLLLQVAYWALQTIIIATSIPVTFAVTDRVLTEEVPYRENENELPYDELIYQSNVDVDPLSPAASISAAYADTDSLLSEILGDTSRFRESPNITDPPRRVLQIEGNSVYFWCRVSGNPTPNVIWYRNERRIDSSSPSSPATRRGSQQRVLKHPTGGSVLLLERVNRNDSALYSCIVKGDSDSAPLNASATLEVVTLQKAPFGGVYPLFWREPSDSVRPQYERDARIELSCRVNCSDSITVFWFKDQLILDLQESNSRTAKRFKDRDDSLVVVQASESDGGWYHCVAVSERGWMAVSRPTLVTVRQRITAPSFLVAPTDLEISSGSDLNLTCVALGNPVPKVQWFNRNLVVSLDQSLTDKLIGIPSIDDTSRTSGGAATGRAIAMLKNLVATSTYTCVAESRYGTINKTITVRVRERPLQPTNLTIVRFSATSATFSWDVPQTTNTETRHFGFTLELREMSDNSQSLVLNCSTASYTAANLRPYTEYSVRVSTIGEIALSVPTEFLQFTTKEAAPSSAPRDVRAQVSNTSNSTIEVSWEEPEEMNGVLTGYTVLYVLTDDYSSSKWRGSLPVSNWTAVDVDARLKRTTLRQLLIDRTYKVAVNARTRAGHGPLCEPLYVTTNSRVPLQPTGLQALVVASNAIQLIWNAPPSNNVDVVSYVVYYNSSSTRHDRIEYRVDTTQMKVVSQRLVNLTPGTDYSIRVSAKGRDGEGPLSNSVAAQTDDSKPASAPEGLRTAPELTRISSGSSALSLHFSALLPNQTNGRIVQHRVYFLRLDNELTNRFTLLQGALTFPLPADFTSVPLLSVLSAPASAPASSSSMSDVQYRELLRQLSSVCPPPRDFPIDANPIVLDTLVPFSRYLICMTAMNSAGESAKSDWILAFTIDSVPNAPSRLNVTALNSTAFTVSWWSPPDAERHGVIKKYIVAYVATGLRQSTVQFDVAANSLEDQTQTSLPDRKPNQYYVTVTSVIPNTEYQVAVKAVTRKGDGAPANAKVRTLPSVPDAPRYLQVVDVPLSDSTAHSCMVRASWYPSANTYGTPLIGYRVRYNRVDEARVTGNSVDALDSPDTQISEMNATQAEVLLDCGQVFQISVVARNRFGESKPVQMSHRTVERVPSGSPEMATFAALSNASARLMWFPPAPSLRGGRILSYAVRCTSESHAFDFQSTTNQTFVILHQLQRSAQYFCQLQAATSVGYGPSTNLSFVFNGEKPKPPKNIATVRLNSTTMRISWMIPPQSISWITIHYIESSRQNMEFSRWRRLRIPVATLCEIDGLSPVEAYLVRLSAVASDGYESDASSEYIVAAVSDPVDGRSYVETFDILSTLSVEDVDSTSITVKWSLSQSLPIHRVREIVSGYRIDYSCARSFIDENGLNKTLPVLREVKETRVDEYRTTLFDLLPACPYRLSLRAVVKSDFILHYNLATRHETACTLPATPPPPPTPERRVDASSIKFYFPASSGENGPIFVYHVVAIPELLTLTRSPESFSNEELLYHRAAFNGTEGIRVAEVHTLPAELLLASIFAAGQLAVNEAYRVFVRAYIDRRSAGLSVECGRQWAMDATFQNNVAFSSSKYSVPFRYMHTAVALDVSAPDDNLMLDRLVLIVGPIGAAFAIILCIVIVFGVVKGQQRSHARVRTRLIDSLYNQSKQADKAFLHANGNGNGNGIGINNGNGNGNDIGGGNNDSEVALFGNGKLIELQDVTIRQPLLGNGMTQEANGAKALCSVSSFPNSSNNGILANGCARFNDSPFATICNSNNSQVVSPYNMGRHVASQNCVTQVYTDVNALVHAPGSASSAATSDQNSGTTHVNSPASAGRLPISVEHFRTHVERLRANENALFSQEYESIDPGSHFTWEHSNRDANKTKNRYANVVAYDHSRVLLTQLDMDPNSDYVNGNFMDGYRKQNAYIATQGPLTNTTADFWRMCWEQRSAVIVMMTKLEERNRVKCDQYWPQRGTETYDELVHVTLNDCQEFAYYAVRSFTIQLAGQAEKREVKQLQYTAWPDHGVPEHPSPLLMFVRRVRSSYVPDMGPVIVHCSAGVGRTGAFIVIDSQLDRIRQEGTIDVFGQVTQLRGQRNYIVQTEDQYIFIHDALLDALDSGMTNGSSTEVPARSLFGYVQKLRVANVLSEGSRVSMNGGLSTMSASGSTATLISGLEAQFRKLQSMRPRSDSALCLASTQPANRYKNRLLNILPYESTRVQLTPLRGIEGSDYINASYIDGYRQRRMYIATQGCMLDTVDDFWRMIWDKQSTIIVMLCKLRESGAEKCAQYWPSERSARFQHLVVDPTAEYEMPSYILREFKVTDARDGLTRTVRQFAFTEWPEQGVPKSGETFVQFIGQVHKTKEQFGQDGPITVHCSSGSGRTGVFIALSMILERLRYEGLVDVLHTVRMLRLQRPSMVQNVEQYQFIYSTVIEYLGSFDHYAT